VGFVGYRDFCDGDKQFIIIPLDTNVDKVVSEICAVKALGGGDDAEDVFGALVTVCEKMKWKFSSRMLAHVTDAPCHNTEGINLHDLKSDDWAGKPHPKGFAMPDPMLQDLANWGVHYVFVKINNKTDKMVNAFKNWVTSLETVDIKGDPHLLIPEIYRSATMKIIKDSKTLTD